MTRCDFERLLDVCCGTARDLFSAGSVANPDNDDKGGLYIERALKLLEKDMLEAAEQLDDALFVEYWGESVPKKERIARWLKKADAIAVGWKPSEVLFVSRPRGKSADRRKRTFDGGKG